jgi:hypothetical protein
MSRRLAGILLIGISAILYAALYLSAAIFGSSVNSWNSDLFNAMLQYVGKDLVKWSTIALYAGIAYLIWAEIESFLKARKK